MSKNREKIVSKGYTLKVVSWENDGDNYKTTSIVTDSVTDLKYFVDICKYCKQTHKGFTIANECSDNLTEPQREWILKLMEKHSKRSDDEEEDLEEFLETTDELLGSSEWYLARVCSSYSVTYSEVDIYTELLDVEMLDAE